MHLKYNENSSDFSRVITQRVNKYFIDIEASKKGNMSMFIKSISFFLLFIFFYLYPLIYSISERNYLVFQFFTGVFLILTALNVGHDAMHGAISKNKRLNYTLGLIFNLSGSNSYVWKLMHNIHHRYPNLHGYDNDISHQNFIRMSPYEKHFWFHKYQHYYVFILALFTTLDYLFYKDFHNFFTKEIGNLKMPQHPRKELYILILSKCFHFFIFLVVPILSLNYSLWTILLGFFVMHFTSGFILYFIFTPAHLSLDVSFDKPNPAVNKVIDSSWAAHQLLTTCNYGNSFLSDMFFGGLNNQIEHHLFPGICHIHYPAISKIIKETASEYNLPYVEYNSFISTIKTNLHFLYKLGNDKDYIFV